MQAVREGAAQGSIRDDIEPEVLLVPVMGTIHTLAGMPGVHRVAPGRGTSKGDAVLSGLERMITSPAGTAMADSAGYFIQMGVASLGKWMEWVLNRK